MFQRTVTLIAFFFMVGAQACLANVTLSANPVDGGSSLRFDRIAQSGPGNKQGIRIRVMSSDRARYQVFQRVLEPIMDEKGETLNLQALETQTLANSNSYGTLYGQNGSFLTMSDQLVYSSSQNGESDAFIIGYSINRNIVNVAGSFRGRLAFTVRGLGNSAGDEAVVDIILQTSSLGGLQVSIKGAHHRNHVHVKETDITQKDADFVTISYSGNLGGQVKIYQELETVPQTTTDENLGKDVLQLDMEGQTEGLRTQGLNSLGTNRTLIYSGNKAEDQFIIYFLINSAEAQKQAAGTYHGRIKYVVETDQGRQEFPVNVQCQIAPVFLMNITSLSGGVRFTHVLAGSVQEQEVVVNVLSNLHKPYQVLQELQTSITNKQGKEFDKKYFTFLVAVTNRTIWPDQFYGIFSNANRRISCFYIRCQGTRRQL
ncbi:MAG: hypothetical protein HQL13_05135 [Candidatus Omnitrophica bacterium]|nr:hypothetical protein [Candidatus Omnitrophota bacterium]